MALWSGAIEEQISAVLMFDFKDWAMRKKSILDLSFSDFDSCEKRFPRHSEGQGTSSSFNEKVS